MKKLRMIVTSVVVLAIVGSAFAFNSKKLLVFCVNTSTNDGTPSQCDAVISGRKIDPTLGSQNYYYTGWDGMTSTCTAASNTNCPVSTANSIKLSTSNN